MWPQLIAGGIKHELLTPPGEDPCNLVPGLPWPLPMCLFPLLSILFFFFVMNLSHDHILSHANPPNGSLNLGLVLGP